MTEKVIERDPKGLLVLILPLAVGMVFLYKAWRWILLGLTLAIAWVAWDKNPDWQKSTAFVFLYPMLNFAMDTSMSFCCNDP
ncbi:MAG: hypothetical protein ACK58N_09220 [Synechocystis sp.]